MRAILIANPKGGSGKTTLATNLAGYLAKQGQRVVMLDLDQQKSSLDWLSLRAHELPTISGIGSEQEISKGDMEKIDWLVLDSPAGIEGKSLAGALKLVNKVRPTFLNLFIINQSKKSLRSRDTQYSRRKYKYFLKLLFRLSFFFMK